MAGRRELHFQKYVIDSYRKQGGYAKKWASEFAVGNPDLVCALPGLSPHLIEMKHKPTWDGRRRIQNPMTDKQKIEAKKWVDAGAMVALGVVTGKDARSAVLHLCHPLTTHIHEDVVWASGKYVLGQGFNMTTLLTEYRRKWDE